jgi:pimeloyl-ACP methyl ester carboxylesterase
MVGIPHTVLMIFAAAALATSGCHQKRPPVTPIPFKYYESGNSPSTTLLVLLPGIHNTIDKFESHGFIDTVHQSGQPCDLVSVDAHYGYYDAGTIVEQLRNDVIIPAQQAGYSDIRIVGISLGGFGALLYANRYSTEVNALVLMAPWLGSEELIDSITAAGGLENWQPNDIADKQSSQDIWLQRKNHSTTTSYFPGLYLGYGTIDKFRQAHTLFAGTLPDDHVFTIAGGHNWSSWEQLWEQMQEQGILCN